MKLGVNMFIWSAEFTPSHLSLLPRSRSTGSTASRCRSSTRRLSCRGHPSALARARARVHGVLDRPAGAEPHQR
jgi:hypothetical protein